MPKSPAKRISYLEGITLKAAVLLTHLRRDHGTAFTPAQHIRIRVAVAECKQIERNALERVARAAAVKDGGAP